MLCLSLNPVEYIERNSPPSAPCGKTARASSNNTVLPSCAAVIPGSGTLELISSLADDYIRVFIKSGKKQQILSFHKVVIFT